MALKLVTMNQNYQFVKVYKRGKNLVHPLLVTYVCKNKGNKGTFRIGITTSKKIGKAHDRNRARRLIKEAVRQLAPQIRPNVDLIFVARSKTCYTKLSPVKKVMESHLREAGVLNEKVAP
ncbi:ribonuclease P protein component [Akkermansia muciniphila]|uniref:ribonuclease P protein component n=1 Tax=Akkermansia muciniphila TaxID=239935 RepID=UPI00122ED79D|nr:ribonuclease P protein component [Akkermansia muciniphila]